MWRLFTRWRDRMRDRLAAVFGVPGTIRASKIGISGSDPVFAISGVRTEWWPLRQSVCSRCK